MNIFCVSLVTIRELGISTYNPTRPERTPERVMRGAEGPVLVAQRGG